MKIHIIGCSGSGKTTLAVQLSKQYAIRHYDLDDLYWDNASPGYGAKREPVQRDALLREILAQDDWIIEGVYYAWCGQCFADADKIYLLTVPKRVYRFRILRRFVRRRLGLEQGKRETLRSVAALLRWTDKYQTKNLHAIRESLAQYSDKVVQLDNH